VHWRWVNASDRTHPMHLHGFYYRVDAEGDGRVDTSYAVESRRMVVTEALLSGATMAMTWGPERPGNWIFHCHVLFHVAHFESLTPPPGESHGQASERMSGLVLMVHVRPGPGAPPPVATAEPQRLRLVAQARPGVYGSAPGWGFALQGGAAAPAADSIQIPGPPLVLTRGRPVEITVVNHLPDATAVHWHGIELDSYYDGVPNMSGDAAHVMRSIAPGDSFVVRFTPPRAGTFMYHTHIHDPLQLQSGMYGPILVLEPGARYDPASDHVLLFSDAGPGGDTLPPAFNGRFPPDTMELAAGHAHRLRFIIIPTGGDAEMRLVGDSGLVTWRPLAKDGRDLPENRRTTRAARQYMAVGETYDFELPPRAPGLLHVQIAIGPQVVWTAPIRVR
ncbi:MAG TPA: multicopper oxidase domain-containing protein, partial [Gemmatimonadales bacterium]